VVAESFLREDAATEDRHYSFLYQLTHITKDRGALTHDDRMDAVAGTIAHFQRAMMMDVDQAAKAMRDEEMLAEIKDFLEGFNQLTYRGMRVNGQRVATWSSRDGWSGDGREAVIAAECSGFHDTGSKILVTLKPGLMRDGGYRKGPSRRSGRMRCSHLSNSKPGSRGTDLPID
jgi:hypothetical protein